MGYKGSRIIKQTFAFKAGTHRDIIWQGIYFNLSKDPNSQVSLQVKKS